MFARDKFVTPRVVRRRARPWVDRARIAETAVAPTFAKVRFVTRKAVHPPVRPWVDRARIAETAVAQMFAKVKSVMRKMAVVRRRAHPSAVFATLTTIAVARIIATHRAVALRVVVPIPVRPWADRATLATTAVAPMFAKVKFVMRTVVAAHRHAHPSAAIATMMTTVAARIIVARTPVVPRTIYV
jgi:hypothetical protein